MEDTSGQRGTFNIVNRITIYDNRGPDSLHRDVVIVELPGDSECVAFYKSTGTSNSSSWSKDTYFPFYGIKQFLNEPNHFIKASEIKTGGYLYVPKWKTILKNAPYLVPTQLLNYFDSFKEIQSSAWLNSGWWLSQIGPRSQERMLKLRWDDENQIYEEFHEQIPTLTAERLARVEPTRLFYLDDEGVKDAINAFLSENNVKTRISKVIVNNEQFDRSGVQLNVADEQNLAVIVNPQDSPSPKKTKPDVGGKKRRTKRKKQHKKVKTIKKKSMANKKSRRR
jgi:hypothetical protein